MQKIGRAAVTALVGIGAALAIFAGFGALMGGSTVIPPKSETNATEQDADKNALLPDVGAAPEDQKGEAEMLKPLPTVSDEEGKKIQDDTASRLKIYNCVKKYARQIVIAEGVQLPMPRSRLTFACSTPSVTGAGISIDDARNMAHMTADSELRAMGVFPTPEDP